MYVEYDKYDRLFLGLFCLMIRRPTRSTRPDTLFPLPPLVLSGVAGAGLATSLSIASGVAMMAWYFARLENYVAIDRRQLRPQRSEGHTSELLSLMRISYAVSCLKKKNSKTTYLDVHQPLLNPYTNPVYSHSFLLTFHTHR